MKWYFTFGHAHTSRLGEPLRKRYVIIEARDYRHAREIMIDRRGLKWSMVYLEDKFLPQIEEYGLTEIGLEAL